MNEETRDAAWKYARCQNHNDRQQEDRSIKDFMVGAGWALRNLRWIPVTESLPEQGSKCLFIVDFDFEHDPGQALGGNYINGTIFSTPGQTFQASHWCPYPEQLLKSIP